MPNILIIGATRGLGASLVKEYASNKDNEVYGTTRSTSGPKNVSDHVKWVPQIDVSSKNVGSDLVSELDKLGAAGSGGNRAFDVVVRSSTSSFNSLRPHPIPFFSKICLH